MNSSQFNDRELTEADIGQIENVDRLIHFFATLGYNVDDAILLDHAILGLDSEDLRQQIHHIHRIASDPDDELIVYLFMVRSVTVALTQAIARRFRERTEEALLVLTTEFDTLDFVLLQKEIVKGKARGQALRQIIRPRPLTVDRRNPDRVALRVLKRFTYTEADGLYQWEKLCSAYDVAEWAEPEFNNRALFSDYYLKNRLTDEKMTPAWAEDVRPIGRQALRQLSQARQNYTGQPLDVVRRDLYEPLFTALGFAYETNKHSAAGAEEPDYLLYASDSSAAGERDQPLAAALTYVWNRNLDNEDPRRDEAAGDDIPGALVVSILENSPAPWVIMTNGKLWRLYSTTASNKATNYYEVDLEEALGAPEQLTFLKYWWLFFRHEAFTGFLDNVLQGSADYAKALGDRLKDRVFTQIFPHFAAGFIHNIRTDMGNPQADFSEEALQWVYEGTLTFLYRLMFVLYAESLELLPLYEKRGYRALSLYKMKEEIARAAGTLFDDAPDKIEQRYSANGTELYDRLTDLFTVIDSGDAALNLPTYNGGLFSRSSDSGQFLVDYKIPDRQLALGLDRLCRDVDDKSQALAFIDFKSLGVRQLGSIYEGLLEFKLRIAPEELAVIKKNKKEVYLPAAQVKKQRVQTTIPKGRVYLENDKKERKATGSYYTPDYIVKYIVENTVGPVLARKFEALRPRLYEAQKLYRQHKKSVAARGHDQPPDLFWNGDAMRQLADNCLNVRVLDPAMGSGHFLVEVVDFVSNRLIDFLNGWTENPVWGLLNRTRDDIVAEMEQQKVTIDTDRLTRVALLKRAVLKRCIYGVDLNLMAVELAKVSLWLDAFTLGAPLSFLDHHLKQGNSLIGERIEEARATIEGTKDIAVQLSIFSKSHFTGMKMAVDAMRQVSFLSDNTVAQVEESREAYNSALDFVDPFKRVLDVYTSRWFGNTPKQTKKDTFDPALQLLQLNEADVWLQNPGTELPKTGGIDWQKIADIALDAAEENSFFHWELEFPEVFFAPNRPGGQDVELLADGGFDALVGNPPYGSLPDSSLIEQHLPSAIASNDLYVAFVEMAFYLCACNHGQLGFITPLSWQTGIGYRTIREKLLNDTSFLVIVNLPFNVFPDAYVDTGIFITQMNEPEEAHSVITIDYPKKFKKQLEFSEKYCYKVIQSDWRKGRQVVVLNPLKLSLLQKVSIVDAKNIPLGEITESGRGILANPEDIVDKLPDSESESWKRFFAGSMDRYEIENTFSFVKYGKNLRESPASFDAFEGERLLVRRIVNRQDRIMATYDKRTFVTKKDIYFFKLHAQSNYSVPYITALLNSQLISFLYLEQDVAATKDDYRQVTLEGIRSLPIRTIPFSLEKKKRANHLQQAKGFYQHGKFFTLSQTIETWLNQNWLEVIHDLLSHLAGHMVELNDVKKSATQDFLEWLENLLEIQSSKGKKGINTLAGYTIIQNYLGDYQKGEPELPWDDFYYRLHENRNRYAANLAQVKGQIEQEYEESLATLRPIKQQLANTDALIDQIVYKLYGLTDEEIELIERPQYEQALSQAKEAVAKDKKLQKDPDAAAEAIAQTVLPAARRLQSRVPQQAERTRLDRDLPGWQQLPGDVPTFLLSGEYDLASRPDHLDFSATVISFAKAVENSLYAQLFLPFRDRSGHSDADCRNKFLQQFMRGERHLTLGSYPIIMASNKETALRRFAAEKFDNHAALFSQSGILGLLQDESNIQLRNKAAHDELLTREDARTARRWALEILRYL